MPSKRNVVPRYRLHKASGQAIVKLNGKISYLGKHGSPASITKYNQKIAEWQAADFEQPASNFDQLTIVELLDAFRQWAVGWYQKDGRATSEVCNFDQAMKPLVLLYGNELVKDFGPRKLKAVRALMVEGFTDRNGNQVRDASRDVINRRVGRIKHIFRWAVAEELAPGELAHALNAVEPLRKGRTTARERPPVKPVADCHVEATLPYLPQVVADMVRVHRLTGCRPTELCVMRPADIDRSESPWRYVPVHHKTEHHEKQRVIFIGPRAQSVLLPYLLRDSESYCFSPSDSEQRRKAELREARKSKVQPSQYDRSKRRPRRKPGNRYTKDSYCRAVRRACDEADRHAQLDEPEVPTEKRLVPRWTPNQLRHAAATEIRRRFKSIEAPQVVLGHSSAVITEVYAERDQQLAADIMRQIG